MTEAFTLYLILLINLLWYWGLNPVPSLELSYALSLEPYPQSFGLRFVFGTGSS
jgi:hypothetical protein